MKQLPTADEFLNKEYYHIILDSEDTYVNVGDIEGAMIEFAKLHVQKALESAAENTREWHGNHGMLKQSILNAYPLDNIK